MFVLFSLLLEHCCHCRNASNAQTVTSPKGSITIGMQHARTRAHTHTHTHSLPSPAADNREADHPSDRTTAAADLSSLGKLSRCIHEYSGTVQNPDRWLWLPTGCALQLIRHINHYTGNVPDRSCVRVYNILFWCMAAASTLRKLCPQLKLCDCED